MLRGLLRICGGLFSLAGFGQEGGDAVEDAGAEMLRDLVQWLAAVVGEGSVGGELGLHCGDGDGETRARMGQGKCFSKSAAEENREVELTGRRVYGLKSEDRRDAHVLLCVCKRASPTRLVNHWARASKTDRNFRR